MHKTLMETLDRTVEQYGDRDALRVKRDGAWVGTSWREYRAQCRTVAKALMAVGLARGEGVAIIGYNCPEWVYADVGAIMAGGMPAGIYTTSSPGQCQYITDHCDARVAFAENPEQARKFIEVRSDLPKLRHIVQMHGAPDHESVMSWKDFVALGEKVSDADLDARIAEQKPDDVATLIYTSGTTADPKAVMLSHANLTWTAEASIKTLGFGPGDSGVSYLPLSHVAEQLLTIHAPLVAGMTVSFAESMEKLGEALKEAKPTYFVGVPRVWEKMQAKMQAAGASAPPLRKKIAAWARRVGLAGGYAEQRGEGRGWQYALADKLVYSKVRAALGFDRCRVAVTSAAPISKDTLEFFLSLGIRLLEVYGMSECTGPTTFSLPDKYKTTYAGFAIPGTELKIAEDGEVCYRGPHIFKGYLKNEAATKEAIDADNWLHSGDIGVLDKDGFLKITDRKKELLITAGGENVAPQLVEGVLKSIPVVSQAVVLGDRQRYLAALITLDPEKVEVEAKAAGSPARTTDEAAKCDKFKAHVEKQIEAVNSELARVQHVRKFAILPNELTIEGGELTPTMKLKRRVIAEKYKDAIGELFA
jgi:long-subunit acyl-CoA synthetase (AMP-forming)